MSAFQPPPGSSLPDGCPEGAIAVIGMACKFPGANSTEEYWQLLNRGLSMVTGPPPGRFPAHDHRRSTERSIFFGNFLANVDHFDHRFFKKSTREAASMDPSQRLLLEVAYQALESSGYFGQQIPALDVGCFVGVCVSDYGDNIASHPANAFSALGMLRAFLAGRISHFFGFTGPSITFDTACSSSAVAIDAACKAIRHGDCSTAIAGGTSVFTSPHLYQNLAAASFLSPTGATKPFDADADGYCRGEGVGLIILKSLSQALKDGDHILGVILSTCVQQNSNQVPITIPHVPSHIALYNKALKSAQVTPDDISYLEAHGTGTLIGDPQEFKGIHKVFTGRERRRPLYFASVKGNIGHTEGASGVAGLIKTLLMIQKRAIPRQASHSRLNPKVNLIPGQLQIPTVTIPWDADPLIAFVSNHGAAGSIAAIIVREPFRQNHDPGERKHQSTYPLVVSGNSETSLRANCDIIRQYISSNLKLNASILADLTFSLSRTQNRNLPYVVSVAVSNISELDQQLLNTSSIPNRQSKSSYLTPAPKPVVLAFGGQHKCFIGLRESVYNRCALLRTHLDECDRILKSFGHGGIYPHIFYMTPINDIVLLQTMQFAIEYACAQSWVDCGLKVDCIVGHSLGELVALSISGALSLPHGLKLVHDRANLMDKKWGSEKGTMIAIRADRQHILKIISSVRSVLPQSMLEIACYNGSRNHVLVGSKAEVDLVIQSISASRDVKYKILDVSRGFHSRFCEPFLDDLERIAERLPYNIPKIHIQRCSSAENSTAITPVSIAQHTRRPVYFENAIKQIEARFGACTWIEAGSDSSITNLVQRALFPSQASHSFFPVDLSQDNGLDKIAETVAILGRHGHHVRFWPFHRLQHREYCMLHLPPYQFEKVSHWLNFNLAEYQPWSNPKTLPSPPEAAVKPVFLTFSGFRDEKSMEATFAIDLQSEELQTVIKGHSLLSKPVYPAPLYVDIAMLAVRELSGILKLQCMPGERIEKLEMLSPLGISQGISLQLLLTREHSNGLTWEFSFQSQLSGFHAAPRTTTHASGFVSLTPLDSKIAPVSLDNFGRLLRFGMSKTADSRPEANIIQGSLIYQLLSKVVKYGEFYKGVRKVTVSEDAISSQVFLPETQPAVVQRLLFQTVAVDNFLQVPGFYFNCLNCPSDMAYICTQIDHIQLSSNFRDSGTSWDIISILNSTADQHCSADVFATEKSTGQPVFGAMGVRFSRVSIASLASSLALSKIDPKTSSFRASCNQGIDHYGSSRVEHIEELAHYGLKTAILPLEAEADSGCSTAQLTSDSASTDVTPTLTITPRASSNNIEDNDLGTKLREILGGLTDVAAREISEEHPLSELGIDSLMSMEIVSEISTKLDVPIPRECLESLPTFASLQDYVRVRLAPGIQRAQEPGNRINLSLPIHNPIVHPVIDPQSQANSHGDTREPGTHSDVGSRVASLLRNHLHCSDSGISNLTSLESFELDSLTCIELRSDIEKLFETTVDLALLIQAKSFAELVNIIEKSISPRSSIPKSSTILASYSPSETSLCRGFDFSLAPANLKTVSSEFENLALEHGFAGFYDRVYEKNSQLVLSYTIEAFVDLGVHLDTLNPGDDIPSLTVDPRHQHLREVLYEIIKHEGIADHNGRSYARTSLPIPKIPSYVQFEQIVTEFPQHAKEHMLLNLCGSDLGSLMAGTKDPLVLLFGSTANRTILEEVYSTSPMYLIMSQLLTRFLELTLTAVTPSSHNVFQIIEIGAGTGSTTRWVVDRLLQLGIPIEYTFTDVSGSLVSAGKRKFSKYECMKYATINIEKEPPAQYAGHFDIVLATNCIHATRSLGDSLKNIYKLLRPNGLVSLVEFTSRMFWFDLVFGLLEGWWRFDDGRSYVLASTECWERSMQDAGFTGITWTGGSSRESEVVRVITGCKQSS
ncbi:hypothetical protein GGR58DRAFT_494846 [Xylaria digitata]|nr:hypothetical protein GGR58DRAFT_494846 [Xylaria digitata]